MSSDLSLVSYGGYSSERGLESASSSDAIQDSISSKRSLDEPYHPDPKRRRNTTDNKVRESIGGQFDVLGQAMSSTDPTGLSDCAQPRGWQNSSEILESFVLTPESFVLTPCELEILRSIFSGETELINPAEAITEQVITQTSTSRQSAPSTPT